MVSAFAPEAGWLQIAEGGAERQDSVRNALEYTGGCDLIAVHDAVRPCFSDELVEKLCDAAMLGGAAIPALAARDTVKRSVDGLRITETLPRSEIWLAQTPQVFRPQILRDVHMRAQADCFTGTDDASLAEYYGHVVTIIPGESENIKLTDSADMQKMSRAMTPGNNFDIRVGYGYDVHRLQEGRTLWLGGVDVPHHSGLLGHSDADALLHAITDAILGALALGDIGSHFPDTDPAYKDMESRFFLLKAVELAAGRGYRIGNVDATIAAQKPKLRSHIDDMRGRIAELLAIQIDRVSVKATTSEKMGFVGREEGMAVMATVLLMSHS